MIDEQIGISLDDQEGIDMFNFVKRFKQSEDGAVTVDFVVLTAALVIMGLVVGTTLTAGASQLAQSQGNSLADRPLGTDWDWQQ